MTQSLFERLGGIEGIKQIANDLVDIHLQNPKIATRFAAFDAVANKASSMARLSAVLRRDFLIPASKCSAKKGRS